jgi:hypothetical protein
MDTFLTRIGVLSGTVFELLTSENHDRLLSIVSDPLNLNNPLYYKYLKVCYSCFHVFDFQACILHVISIESQQMLLYYCFAHNILTLSIGVISQTCLKPKSVF